MQNQNNLEELNKILFDSLRKIENAEGEELQVAINKSKAITSISKEIIDVAKTKINALSIMKDLTVPAQVATFKTVAQVNQSEVDEYRKLSIEK